MGAYSSRLAGNDYLGVHHFSDDYAGTAKMKIRSYEDSDWPAVQEIHERAELPINCLADAASPLCIIKRVIEENQKVVMAAFVRVSSEPFLLVDGGWATPEKRWEALQLLERDITRIARSMSLPQLTCWIPNELEKSFGKRLEEMGYVKSPWASWSKNL